MYLFSWLTRTDPADVARVESKTVICTDQQRDTIPIPREGVDSKLGKWISPSDMETAFNSRFPGCMKGIYTSSILLCSLVRKKGCPYGISILHIVHSGYL